MEIIINIFNLQIIRSKLGEMYGICSKQCKFEKGMYQLKEQIKKYCSCM